MPSKQNIYSPAVRKRKAYSIAFRVFFSYLWLHLKSKILGRKYRERHIKSLHLKNADRIKAKVVELQGLFIKIGQLISNLSNILPEEFRAPLEELQDHTPPKPYAEIERTIEQQLGAKPEELFSNFSKEPLAAASIGQVHRAELDGQQIVVKIQHANIDTIARADLAILKNLVKIHAFFMDIQGLDHTYDQVKQMIEEELDYTKEAQSMQKVSDNIKDHEELQVKIPALYPKYCTTKVLTSQYYEGVNIGHINELKNWGLNLEDVAKRLVELYCKMILIDGFYHADPHPGNILVNRQGELILLDFGAVAHLNIKTKKAIPELIESVIKNDTEATVAALKKMGFIGSDKDSKVYIEHLIEIFKEFLQNEVQLDGMNFQNIKLNSGLSSLTSFIRKIDLRDVSSKLRIPKDYILLNRTLVLLIGNAFQLAPELNTLDVVRPYIKKHVIGQDGGFSQLIIKTFKNQIATAISLPNEFSKFLKHSTESDLGQEIRGLKNSLTKIYFLGQQFLYVLILICLIYFAYNYDMTEPAWLQKVHLGSCLIVGWLLIRSVYRDTKM